MRRGDSASILPATQLDNSTAPMIAIGMNKLRTISIYTDKYSLPLLRLTVAFYIVTLPLGQSFREIGAIGSLITLIAYYSSGFKKTNLALFPLQQIFFAFILFFAFNILISMNPHESLHVYMSWFYNGPILFLAGLEAVRKPRDIATIVILFSIMNFYEGLDGVYQYLTGIDLIQGDAPIGEIRRLTGSLSTPRVANLLCISLSMMCAFPFVIRRKLSTFWSWTLFIVLITPGIFLLLGTKTRSGIFSFALSFILMIALSLHKVSFTHKYKFLSRKNIFITGVVLATLAIASAAFLRLSVDKKSPFYSERLHLEHYGDRFAFSTIEDNSRFIDIYPAAIKIFMHYPLFGAGIGTFHDAKTSLGIVFKRIKHDIPHPHDIYLQFLCETGIVGFFLAALFLGGCTIWSLRKIFFGLKNKEESHLWHVISFFWCAYVSYLFSGLSAHSFFRTWWAGISMTVLGLTIGACLLMSKKHQEMLSF